MYRGPFQINKITIEDRKMMIQIISYVLLDKLNGFVNLNTVKLRATYDKIF